MLSVKISRDMRFLLSGSRDKSVRLWNVETGEWLNTYEVRCNRGAMYMPDFASYC